jgi:3-methyladenine DNA glycosylase Tag
LSRAARESLQLASTSRFFLPQQALEKSYLGMAGDYVWAFVDGTPKINRWTRMSQVPATSAESDTLSKDLKRRGVRFVGSTIIYVYLQAAGLVNNHTSDCFQKSIHRGLRRTIR